MPFTGFRLTTERISCMITLLALNNFLGFIASSATPWFIDEHQENCSIWAADTSAGVPLIGTWLALVGGIICTFLVFILYWVEAKLADWIGSSWIATFVGAKLKWTLMIAAINCSGWGLLCGFQTMANVPSYVRLGPGFFTMFQNCFYCVIAIALLLYLPCASNEKGDSIWNAYGYFEEAEKRGKGKRKKAQTWGSYFMGPSEEKDEDCEDGEEFGDKEKPDGDREDSGSTTDFESDSDGSSDHGSEFSEDFEKRPIMERKETERSLKPRREFCLSCHPCFRKCFGVKNAVE